MSGSIYSTPEGEAWCRDFTYSDYLMVHTKMECKAKQLSEQGYKDFCKFMNDEMMRHFESEQES